MRDSSDNTLPEREGVATHKVSSLAVGIVEGVEEIWSRRAEQVRDMLLQDVDILTGRVLCHKAVIICTTSSKALVRTQKPRS